MSAAKGPDANYDGLVSPHAADVEKGATKEGASVLMMVLISMPRVATQMAWAAQWAAIGPYLSTMLPGFAVQLTQLIGPLTGILTAPTIGVCSDRSTNKWGRRRPFLVYAAITSVICWIGMGFTRPIAEALGDWGDNNKGSRKWTAALTIIFYCWMDITVNVVQTPSQLLIADFAGDRQTLGAGIGQAWSTFGAILVAAYISWFGPAHESLGYFLGMLCVFMIVTVAVACIVAKEEPLVSDTEALTKGQQICEAFKSIGRGLMTLPKLLLIYALIFFCLCYANSAYSGNKGQFFGIYVKSGDATNADKCKPTCSESQKRYNDGVQVAGGTTDLLYNLLGYAYSWLLPVLVSRFGARWVLTISVVPEALLLIMAFCKVVWIDVVIVVLTTISQTTVFTMVVPVVIHVMGDNEDIGIYVGAMNSANCIGMLLNFLIGSALVETAMGYQLPMLVGGLVTSVGVIISAVFFKVKMYTM